MSNTVRNIALAVAFTGIAGSAIYGMSGQNDRTLQKKAEAAAKVAEKATAERETVSADLKSKIAERRKNTFGLLGMAELKTKDSAELSKAVAGYVAAGKTGKVLELINKNAYVLEKPEDYLAVAATLSKSLGETGSMWFFEESGMKQKRNGVGTTPGKQSRELTVEAATVYALALSMDNRMDERFLRLGFATFTKHLDGREKTVNGMIALYWGFREAVKISCGTLTLQDAALLAPKEEARTSLLRFLSATMNNAEANEEYRAMAAKLLTFSNDASAKAAAGEYLKGVKGNGRRMLETIEKFEAQRRANLLDA